MSKSDQQALGQRAVHGLMWTFAGTAARAIFQIVITMILARLLSPVEFGVVAAASVAVGFVDMLTVSGLRLAIVQQPVLTANHIRVAFTLSVVSAGLMCSCMLAIAPTIAAFFGMASLTAILRVLAILFVVRGIAVVSAGLLTREMKFREIAIRDVVSYVLGYGAVGIPLAYLGAGVWSLVWAQIAQSVVGTGLLLAVKRHSMLFSLEKTSALQIAKFSGPFSVSRILSYIALQGDSFIIAHFMGASQLGVYNRAYTLMSSWVLLFGSITERVVFPAMSTVQTEPDRLASGFRRGVNLMCIITIPASAVSIVLAPEIVQVLLGSQWGAAIEPFRILAFGILFRSGYRLGDAVATARGAVYGQAWRRAVYAFVVVAGGLAGKEFGLDGVAVAVTGALFTNYVLAASLAIKQIDYTWRGFLAAHRPGLILGCALGAVAAFAAIGLRGSGLPASGVLAGVVGILLVSLTITYNVFRTRMLNSDVRWLLGECRLLMAGKRGFGTAEAVKC